MHAGLRQPARALPWLVFSGAGLVLLLLILILLGDVPHATYAEAAAAASSVVLTLLGSAGSAPARRVCDARRCFSAKGPLLIGLQALLLLANASGARAQAPSSCSTIDTTGAFNKVWSPLTPRCLLFALRQWIKLHETTRRSPAAGRGRATRAEPSSANADPTPLTCPLLRPTTSSCSTCAPSIMMSG